MSSNNGIRCPQAQSDVLVPKCPSSENGGEIIIIQPVSILGCLSRGLNLGHTPFLLGSSSLSISVGTIHWNWGLGQGAGRVGSCLGRHWRGGAIYVLMSHYWGFCTKSTIYLCEAEAENEPDYQLCITDSQSPHQNYLYKAGKLGEVQRIIIIIADSLYLYCGTLIPTLHSPYKGLIITTACSTSNCTKIGNWTYLCFIWLALIMRYIISYT